MQWSAFVENIYTSVYIYIYIYIYIYNRSCENLQIYKYKSIKWDNWNEIYSSDANN